MDISIATRGSTRKLVCLRKRCVPVFRESGGQAVVVFHRSHSFVTKMCVEDHYNNIHGSSEVQEKIFVFPYLKVQEEVSVVPYLKEKDKEDPDENETRKEYQKRYVTSFLPSLQACSRSLQACFRSLQVSEGLYRPAPGLCRPAPGICRPALGLCTSIQISPGFCMSLQACSRSLQACSRSL